MAEILVFLAGFVQLVIAFFSEYNNKLDLLAAQQ
jgi:hypothetical protein